MGTPAPSPATGPPFAYQQISLVDVEWRNYRGGQTQPVWIVDADFDVKSLNAGGGAVVYEQGGYIHLHDPASGTTNQVDITVRGDFPWLRPHWENVGGLLQNASLSPTGVRALSEGRGDIFTVPAEDGDWRNLTRTSGVAERSPAWSPDGRHIS